MIRGFWGRVNQAGVTLVELMVATALVGISTLALMTILADYSKRMASAQNDANLSEQLVGFSDLLETYLGNATLIYGCGCGPNPGALCVYSELAPDCTLGGGKCVNATLLRFEFEDSNFPGQVAAGNCIMAGGFPGGAAPDGLIPRGCKRRARLAYTPPTSMAPGPSTAGILSVVPEDINGNPAAQPFFSISGVTSLRCGHLPNPLNPNIPTTDSFRIRIGVKARASNAPPGDPNFDSWFPTDLPSFDLGTHRSLTTDVQFRNLTVGGIHFGKAETTPNCTLDGQTDLEGDCCSGYWDSSSGVCLAMAACLPRGAALTGIGLECCSHMGINGVCR